MIKSIVVAGLCLFVVSCAQFSPLAPEDPERKMFCYYEISKMAYRECTGACTLRVGKSLQSYHECKVDSDCPATNLWINDSKSCTENGECTATDLVPDGCR